MTNPNPPAEKWEDFLKDVGWNEPEYGWTKEKAVVKSFISSQIKEANKNLISKIREEMNVEFGDRLDQVLSELEEETEK